MIVYFTEFKFDFYYVNLIDGQIEYYITFYHLSNINSTKINTTTWLEFLYYFIN